jgi:hypothetical protein
MIILQDTKEKMPWSLSSYDMCERQIATHLEEGDYTLEAYPFLIAIERKRNVSEIARNLGVDYVRFKNEMDRLQQYRFRYVVCEFSESEVINYPHASKLPPAVKAKVRMNGGLLISRIRYITDNYGIEFIYCNNRLNAQRKAIELLLNAEAVYLHEKLGL